MGIQVALVDKSEIIQKMLAHCLHYFSSEILRFDSLEDCQAHFSDKKPDIVFVDEEIESGGQTAIYSAVSAFKPVPAVLLYRASHTQVHSISLTKVPYRMCKPLNPNAVRELIAELVPRVKESDIHSFLKFPKSGGKDSQFGLSPRIGFSEDSEDSEQKIKIPFEKKDSEKKQSKPVPSAPGSAGSKLNMSLPNLDLKGVKPSRTSAQKIQAVDSGVQKEKTFTKKFVKENVNIDEDTQNDLAPMAIKTATETKRPKTQGLELGEAEILKVLNKYKDTMEFQEIMEKVLSKYAESAIAGILQSDKVNGILEQPLKDFKEGQKFKEIVENQISQYIKEHLPLAIKDVVEREIKKIIAN